MALTADAGTRRDVRRRGLYGEQGGAAFSIAAGRCAWLGGAGELSAQMRWSVLPEHSQAAAYCCALSEIVVPAAEHDGEVVCGSP
jgi:hypothetical protein